MYPLADSSSFRWSARVFIVSPAETDSLGWLARVSIVYTSQNWFVVVVSYGFYCIPQPNLVHWGGQPGSSVCPSQNWFIGVVSQGFIVSTR